MKNCFLITRLHKSRLATKRLLNMNLNLMAIWMNILVPLRIFYPAFLSISMLKILENILMISLKRCSYLNFTPYHKNLIPKNFTNMMLVKLRKLGTEFTSIKKKSRGEEKNFEKSSLFRENLKMKKKH